MISFKLEKLALGLFVMVSLLSMGCLSYAQEPEVAGAEIYVSPTPTPTPTPELTNDLQLMTSPTPMPTVSATPSSIPESKSGFLEWLMEPMNLLWLGILALIIVVSIYLSRRKRNQSPV
jgi:hypothetical protein